jgi:hypothetical protein
LEKRLISGDHLKRKEGKQQVCYDVEGSSEVKPENKSGVLLFF